MFSQASVSRSVQKRVGWGIIGDTVDKRAARILLECFLVRRWGDSWNPRFELTEILFYSNFRFRFTLPNQNKNLFKLNVWKDFNNRENVWTVAELSWSKWENPYHFFRTIRRKPDIKIYCRTQYETSVNWCYWRSLAGWQRKENNILLRISLIRCILVFVQSVRSAKVNLVELSV